MPESGKPAQEGAGRARMMKQVRLTRYFQSRHILVYRYACASGARVVGLYLWGPRTAKGRLGVEVTLCAGEIKGDLTRW